MAKKQFVIGAGTLAIIAGLALGVTSGFSLSKGEPTMAQTQVEAPAVAGQHTNAAIEEIKAELDSVAQYETAYGCMTFGKFNQPELCGASKERVDALHAKLIAEVQKLELSERTSEGIASAKANIQELNGSAASEISFQGTSANPYTNVVKRIEHWADPKGFDYWVDPATNKVVQFGPGPDSKIAFERDGSKSLSNDQLRQIAEEYLSKNVADFDQIKADFSYKTMSKPGNATHAFRWESKSKPKGEDVIPFVQVVLSPIGEVMSFADVRSLYSN